MSKLAGKTIEWLKDAEQRYIDGMPAVTDANRKRLMQIGLDAVREELQRRAQKKSVEPSANQGQLPVVAPDVEQENKAAFFEERKAKEAKQEFEAAMQKANLLRSESNPVENKAFRESVMNAQQRVIGTVTEAPVITVPVVQIALSSGTKQMNRVEIMNMLKTWFKRVATSKAMEKGLFSDAYGGAMGQDTYKLFQGWNTIYNETQEGAAWPPLEDVFPGLGRASQSQKVNAEILWRWASNDKENSNYLN